MAPNSETKKEKFLGSARRKQVLASIKNLFRKRRNRPHHFCVEPPSLQTPKIHDLNPIVEDLLSQKSSLITNQQHCKLCLENYEPSQMYSLKNCNCTFCLKCVQIYLVTKIKDGDVHISCPDDSCRIQSLFQEDEVRQLLPNSLMYLYEKLKLNQEVASDPTKCWCPGPRCEAVCYLRPTQPGETVAVFCQSCGITFCSGCKCRWHPRRTCQQLVDHMEQINRLGQSGNIKYCPKCIVPIEHMEGCAQMVCKQCRHNFCWHCLQSLQGDLFLRHYDEGPCKDKLGHPRAGIFVHRFGTYATYTALTVAILFGAPLLIVCLPCLLCMFQVYNRLPADPPPTPL